MKKRNLKFRMFLAFFVLILIAVACDDGFNENEFLEKQAQLAETKASQDHARALELIQAQLNATLAAMSAQAQYDEEMALLQAMLTEELEKLRESLKSKEDSTSAANLLAAYRNAGLITEYKVIFQSDGEAVEGIGASISTLQGSLVSDATGTVTFTDVLVGPNELVVNSDDYIDFNLSLSFSAANVTQVGQASVVAPKKAFSVLNLFSGNVDLGQTGTIRGKVSIDSDLTNDGAELPPMDAVKVAVNFDASFAQNELIVSDGEVVTTGMKFTEGELGIATVNPQSGEYSIVVPASDEGVEYELSVSEITTFQKIASAVDYLEVQTVFNAGSSADAIPFVQGILVKTDITPSEPGSGAQLLFNKLPRNYVGPFNSMMDLNPQSSDNATFQLTSRGSGYQASPDIVLSSSGEIVGYAFMQGFLKAYNVTDQGKDYTTITVKVFVQGKNLINNDFETEFMSFDVTPVDGKLPEQFSIPAFIDGGSKDNLKLINNGKITSYSAVVQGDGTGAELDVVLDLQVSGINHFGLGSSVNTPEFTFQSELAPTTAATMKLFDYKFQYTIGVDNTNASGYEVLPENVSIYLENGNLTQTVNYNGGYGFQNVDLINEIRLNGEGGLMLKEEGVYRTAEFFKEVPKAVIEEKISTPFTFDFDLSENGELTNLVVETQGSGYAKPFNIVVSPRYNTSPGSGAQVLSNVVKNNTTGEFVLQDFMVTATGNGYLANLNQSVQNAGFGNGEKVKVKTGQTVFLDIDYGTGLRTTSVSGDN